MTKKPGADDDLGDLLAERDRVIAWLSALEGRKDTTPPQVFAKVHGDYSARRDAVLGQLRERAGELQGKVEKLAAKLAAVEVEQRSRQEARAEAELRAAVGEFTESRWAELSSASDAELAKLEARRTEVAREHAQAVELLAGVRRSGAHAAVPETPPEGIAQVPAAAPAPTAAPRPGAPAVAEPELVITALGEMLTAPGAQVRRASAPVARASAAVPRPSGAVAASPEELAARRIKTPSADELAFLRSIEIDETRRSAAGSTAPPPAAPPAPGAPSRPSRPVAPEPAPSRPSQPIAADAAPARATPPDPRATTPSLNANDAAMLTDAAVNVPRASTDIHPDAAKRRETAPRLTSRDSANLLKGVQSEHAKTLKCGNCGAANFPTEWYCERCGSELSAV
ncbi:MAG: hypothetical protein HYX65_07115 [Gemmatimonadetes bacterium]|nr:hypothetical protein [Gemmatimonadota bacterium]